MKTIYRFHPELADKMSIGVSTSFPMATVAVNCEEEAKLKKKLAQHTWALACDIAKQRMDARSGETSNEFYLMGAGVLPPSLLDLIAADLVTVEEVP